MSGVFLSLKESPVKILAKVVQYQSESMTKFIGKVPSVTYHMFKAEREKSEYNQKSVNLKLKLM